MAYTSINDPSAHFQTATYSGTGSAQSITNDGNSNLQPDWMITKNRTGTTDPMVNDSSRGVGTYLFANRTNAEATDTIDHTSFDSDGFSVSTGESVNDSGDTFVAWQWKANGGTTSSNTSGTITSTVQANTDAGFSVVTYSGNSTSGATIGHGLGVAPNWIIVKARTLGGNWIVGSTALDSTLANRCVLNSTAAASSNTGDFNAAPTSSVFQLGSSLDVNSSTKTYVAYCFAEKQGYSKIGKYFGNGNADGAFVYTGFKPAFIMIKRSDSTSNWTIWDSKRDPFNYGERTLFPNGTSVEESGNANERWDLLSNGFKFRSNGRNTVSGGTYIYMAFAENPFVTSTGIPTTAR